MALFAVLIVAPVAAQADPAWQRYVDGETGLHVSIPVDVFTREQARAPHARKLATDDGRANITIQTVPNERRSTPAAFLASKGPPPGIVYRRVTQKFFVVSSFKNGMIFYNRCNFAGTRAHCVLINYPAREKARWDGIVTKISRSLTL
jgi:hypothetical protein